MPHASLKLKPGVDQNETPTLNEAGISNCNLIRFIYDRNGIGLVQKLGGWTKFYPNTISAIPRALWAWEDTESQSYLACGTQDLPNTYQSQLTSISNGSSKDITPRSATDNVSLALSTTAGSAAVVITDTTIENITSYDSVYIPVHISIGGVVLFGLYSCDPNGYLSPDQYTIFATDQFGNNLPVPNTSTTAYVPSLATVSGSNQVTVTLNNHGFNAGSTFPILILTQVGGLTLFGNYIVENVINANSFVIYAQQNATSTTSGSINNGKARYIYSFGIGAVPAGSGYGIGGYGSGGYGTGPAVTPSTGVPIEANNWTLDNWGEVLVSCPIQSPIILTAASASGTGSTGTINFTGATITIDVGETITVSGASPNSWNGVWTVTSSTPTSVSFATTTTAAITSPGTILVNNTPFQPIYQWDPLSGNPTSTIIPQAPQVNDGIFVAMPQRQIIAWGSTFTGVKDPLLIRWCDVNNYGTWIAQITNQAGSYRIPKGSKIVGCIQGPQQGLVWTDLGLWSMQYVGQPYVYSFNEIGTGCGLISRKAAASINGVVYWMGPSQFFSLTSSGVQVVTCPVWDVIYQDLDQTNLDKIRVAVNSRFNEITWYYPTISDGGEVNAYAKYNVGLGVWDFGTLGRSAWVDQSVLGPPIGADPFSLYIYQHETSTNADGQAMNSWFQTGNFVINEADNKMFVDEVWPDMKWGYYGGSQNATINLTFYVSDYAGQTQTQYGPFALTQNTTFVSPRFRGRLVSIYMGSNDVGSFWRIGNMRYRTQQDGRY